MRGRHSEAVLRRGGSSMWVAAATLAFVVLSTFPHSASSARKPSEWARMTDEEWEAVAAQWEEDDDPEERKPEGQYEYERMMRAKEEGIPQGVDLNDPDEYFAATQSMGHTMMFADIHKEHDIKELGYRWREQLFLGGIEVTFYDVDEHTLLVTLQRGWNGIQLKDFLINQEEVRSVNWQEKKFKGVHSRSNKKKKTRKKSKKQSKDKKKREKAGTTPSKKESPRKEL